MTVFDHEHRPPCPECKRRLWAVKTSLYTFIYSPGYFGTPEEAEAMNAVDRARRNVHVRLS